MRRLHRAGRAAVRADLQRAGPATHHPVAPDPRFAATWAFSATGCPDREARVEEFFLPAAALLPGERFLLGGSGWGDKADAPERRLTSATSTPPTTTRSTARRAPC